MQQVIYPCIGCELHGYRGPNKILMKRLLPFLILSFPVILFLMEGCHPKQAPPPVEKPVVTVAVPSFNADTAYYFIQRQMDFGPRVPNTEAHDRCEAYLSSTLKGYTPNVIIQRGKVRAYNGTVLNMENIMASFNPDMKTRIFLAAHWDSRPFADHDPDPARRMLPVPAANDGASGVGVLLEVARQLNRQSPPVGVDIVLLDVEDYGPPEDERSQDSDEEWGLGAQYWAGNPHVPGYRARYGILLDMVGAADARFPEEYFSNYYAPDIVNKVWTIARDLGYQHYFVTDEGAMINDDHYFINTIMHVPTIDIIDLRPTSSNGTFFEQWHTTHDDMSIIDKSTLKVVGQVVLTVIYRE